MKELDVPFVHIRLDLAEGNACGIDDGCLGPEGVDKADPALTVQNGDVIFGRNVDVLLRHGKCPFGK